VKNKITVVEQEAADAAKKTGGFSVRTMLSRSHSRFATSVGVTLAIAVLLAACSSGGSAGNAPSPAPSSSPSTVDPSLKVPAPLPTQELLSNPCSALTDAQLTQLGLTSPGRASQGPPPLCGWNADGSAQNGVNAGPVPQNKGGISDIYAQKAKQAYFEPVTVNGYPGVFADTQDGRASGSCTLWVGITDQLAYAVVTSIAVGQNKATTCASAQKVGEAVIAHLKGAA
jgi:hypothetical protein